MASQQSRELKELSDSCSRRLRDLDDRGTAVERDLRNQLLQQSQDLNEETARAAWTKSPPCSKSVFRNCATERRTALLSRRSLPKPRFA